MNGAIGDVKDFNAPSVGHLGCLLSQLIDHAEVAIPDYIISSQPDQVPRSTFILKCLNTNLIAPIHANVPSLVPSANFSLGDGQAKVCLDGYRGIIDPRSPRQGLENELFLGDHD